jgi:hypothetical protein
MSSNLFSNVRFNETRTASAAIHHDGAGYVVTLWTEETDRFTVADRFDHEGPSYTKDGKAALAMAKGCVASLVAQN